MKHQLGLALSGGGVRGAAHAGVIKALEEENIEVSCIAGTSAGALAGAILAAGYSSEGIIQFFRQLKQLKVSAFSFRKPGLLDTLDYFGLLSDYLGDATYESLEKELFVAATDLLKAECKIFDSGPVIPSVRASAAAPLVFIPVEIEGGLYMDGGIVNNFPIEPLLDKCEYILGVSVNPLVEVRKEDLSGVFNLLERVYHISTRYDTALKIDKCDWLVQSEELLRFNIFDMNKADEAFEIGYKAALEVVEPIKEKLK